MSNLTSKMHATRRTILQGSSSVALAALFGSTFGDRSVKAAPTGEPIIIGHQCDLTGPLADSGYWRKKSTDAAVKWVNDNGGISGRPIKIITYDTEAKVDVGLRRLQEMIQEAKTDFVIGAEHGGVASASVPIIGQLKTVYLPFSRTDQITMEMANRYVFRIVSNTTIAAKAAASWMASNVGKRWIVLYADYAWGQSHNAAWTREIKSKGGEVVQSLGMPVNVSDPLPFLSQFDRSADAIFMALLPPDANRVFPALRDMAFRKPILTAGSMMGLFDALKLGSRVENVWVLDEYPWTLSDLDTQHNKIMRDAIGLDLDGREVGTGRFSMIGDTWAAWEHIGFIKRNVEGSGWQSRSDTDKFISYAERNPNYAEGALFPQGSMMVRAEDHQAFTDFYIFQIEQGRYRVKHKVPKESTVYSSSINLTK